MLALLAVGCGGSNLGIGNLSGVVFDQNGDVVRNAKVSAGGHNTQTNSSGAYVLTGVSADDLLVTAEVTVSGNKFTGQNVARVFQGERTKSLNIAVYPSSGQAGLEGFVTDRQGFLVSGARVFVRQNDGAVLSSSTAISDGDGHYEIHGLRQNLAYAVVCNGRTFDSDTGTVTLSSGETRRFDFVLPDTTDKTLAIPNLLSAQAFTSPAEATRDARQSTAIEAIKRQLDPKRAARKVITKTLNRSAGVPIEVDLTFDRLPVASLLGYGIYRGVAQGELGNIDFARDPLAEIYEDQDALLVEGETYFYGITSLSTSFSGNGQGESNLSSVLQVTPLGEVSAGTVAFNPGPVTFNWPAASGAQTYQVLLYDAYPSIGIGSGFHFFSTAQAGRTYTYNGPALTAGRTYYYVILGSADSGNSLTISRVSSFVMN